MEKKELNYPFEQWQEDFQGFIERFADLFGRSKPRDQCMKYVKALLSPVERKNGWQMAEHVGDEVPDPMQRLLYRAHWDAGAAIDRLQEFTVEKFGDEEAVGVLDETGFLKQGNSSAGVKRQYSGTAGKVENCQVGTFLVYATKNCHLLMDRRLYLPEDWCDDKIRRRRARIPDEVRFHTKTEHAVEMLENAWESGVPMAWVTGDAVYGNAPHVRNAVNSAGKHYVLGVSSTITVWTKWPEAEKRKRHGRRREVQKPKYPPPTPVAKVVAGFKPGKWKRFSVGDGEKGSRLYDWARTRVVENEDGYPVRRAWLVARRSVSDPSEVKHFISNGKLETPLWKLAQVAATRFTIEQCFKEAKGETGLDQYEVRNWTSWHRHIALSMMAHTFLAWVRLKGTPKKGALTPRLPISRYPKCAS